MVGGAPSLGVPRFDMPLLFDRLLLVLLLRCLCFWSDPLSDSMGEEDLEVS